MICIESQFLPPVSYFSLLMQHELVFIEAHEHFQKQSYRNRTKILTANGVNDLTVPIKHHAPQILICDAELDNTQNWPIKHWRSIKTAYGKAPYFEYFGDYFAPLFDNPPTSLFDFNHQLLLICLKLLKINCEIHFTEKYEISLEIVDFRNVIHPKKEILGEFSPYQQNFGATFVPNLSIIDLLMCQGPQASGVLARTKIL